jgi:hypothetical protein
VDNRTRIARIGDVGAEGRKDLAEPEDVSVEVSRVEQARTWSTREAPTSSPTTSTRSDDQSTGAMMTRPTTGQR